MEVHKLKDMVNGWFIGNFSPSLYATNDVEVGVKHYLANDYEETHYHKVATEFTLIVSGEVLMNGNHYTTGDIIVIKPFESTDFSALTDVTTVVVKIPGTNNDKYIL